MLKKMRAKYPGKCSLSGARINPGDFIIYNTDTRTAVDLNRRIIEIRAGQAKTDSQRVVPITDNLAAR